MFAGSLKLLERCLAPALPWKSLMPVTLPQPAGVGGRGGKIYDAEISSLPLNFKGEFVSVGWGMVRWGGGGWWSGG